MVLACSVEGVLSVDMNIKLVLGELSVRCVIRYIFARMQSLTTIYLVPGGHESSIYRILLKKNEKLPLDVVPI